VLRSYLNASARSLIAAMSQQRPADLGGKLRTGDRAAPAARVLISGGGLSANTRYSAVLLREPNARSLRIVSIITTLLASPPVAAAIVHATQTSPANSPALKLLPAVVREKPWSLILRCFSLAPSGSSANIGIAEICATACAEIKAYWLTHTQNRVDSPWRFNACSGP